MKKKKSLKIPKDPNAIFWLIEMCAVLQELMC